MTIIALLISCNSFAKNNSSSVSDDEVEIYIEKVDNARSLGLPTDACPLKYYFNNRFKDREDRDLVTEEDVDESSVHPVQRSEDYYYFFVQDLSVKNEIGNKCISIWMYDTGKNKVSKVYTQQKDIGIYNVEITLDVQHHDTTFIDEGTQQQITMQQYEITPVLILACQEVDGGAYGPYSTLILHPESKQNIRLEFERFVKVFVPDKSMLMMRLWGYAKNYILTTTTKFEDKELPYKQTEEFSGFYQYHLTPTINVYTTSGKRIGKMELPKDIIEDFM